MHILINGLSAGTGGGLTVARDIAKYLSLCRPDWKIRLFLIEGHPLHLELVNHDFPANCKLEWAPYSCIRVWQRDRFERSQLADWCTANSINVAINLNGILVPRFPVPTICHFQDPFPYRPEAWDTLKQRIIAFGKRRRHRYSLKHSWACGWTSQYLHDLICGYHGTEPQNSSVFYNGIPHSWTERVEQGEFQHLSDRPLQISTVSNVFPYKRQELIIRAVAQLHNLPEMRELVYRIIGAITPEYRNHLNNLARRLQIENHVFIEGRVPDARVQQVLSQSRAMCLMSVCESFGIPPIEAMSYGTPVVVSRSCALPEICDNAALYCPEDDLDTLVQQIRNVLLDQSVAADIQQKGIHRVKEFSWEQTAELFSRVIEQLSP